MRMPANMTERIKNGNWLLPGKLFCPITFTAQIAAPINKNKIKLSIKVLLGDVVFKYAGLFN